MVATMALSGTAFAEPPVQANPSCFGVFASSPTQGGPGPAVSGAASGLASPGTPGSGTDEAASNIGALQQERPCPIEYPFDQPPQP